MCMRRCGRRGTLVRQRRRRALQRAPAMNIHVAGPFEMKTDDITLLKYLNEGALAGLWPIQNKRQLKGRMRRVTPITYTSMYTQQDDIQNTRHRPV